MLSMGKNDLTPTQDFGLVGGGGTCSAIGVYSALCHIIKYNVSHVRMPHDQTLQLFGEAITCMLPGVKDINNLIAATTARHR